MGALAVLAMADNAENTPPDPAVRRPVHPFFAQNRPPAPSAENHVVNDPSVSSDSPDLPIHTTGSGQPGDGIAENPAAQRGRRRKAQHHEDEEDMPKKPRPTKRSRNSAGAGIADHFVKLAKGCEHDQPADPSAGPPMQHDRLPACIADKIDHGAGDQAAGDQAAGDQAAGDQAAGDQAADSSEVNPPTIEQLETGTYACVPEPKPALQAAEANPAKPKRLLLFNPKTGTIGSPPKPREASAAAAEAPGIEKKPSGQRGRKPASKIVRITYGTDPDTRARLGKLINSIITGQTEQSSANLKQSPQACDQKPPPKAPKPTAPTSSKATHPFFTGQSKKPDSIAEDAKLKTKFDSTAEDPQLKKPDSVSEEPKVKKPALSPISARTKHYTSTPYSPRKPRAGLGPKIPMPRFGVKSLGLKFAGAKMPAWPWQGMVHVRGDQSEALGLEYEPLPLASRKSKGHAVKVSTNESIITVMVNSLDLSVMAAAIRNLGTDDFDFIPPPLELRLPQKHFESGSKLQSRILPELKTFHPSVPRKGSAPRSKGATQPPAQLVRLYSSIASSLSAFDMSQCETSNWVQKYAPTCAVEVLQSGQEAFLLRDWLQALMVQSVDTGSADTGKSKAGAKVKAAVAGKKKRRKKLDGFIVSSEDEGYELCEPSDEDADWAPSGSRGILRKTVVRSGKSSKGGDGDKTANALVISGPHGCGKTAAVYAVAKELDFEVFEINSSSRRSGKDVLEKIGDMTRNHHVQQHQSASALDAQDSPAEDHTAEDLNSGKQSIMNAFFKPKTATAKSKEAEKPAAKSLPREVKKEPPKNQRQSLILIEEADILYEEDKQFWTTIVSLIAQAKRPFIITCNDETLIQLHTLRLHGIFRLSSAPRDLAVDRLILVAANEGHALSRKSVEQLYDSRHCDMRAATMDLQYWCQLGVGDRRGGFDWFYPRWPKGVDLDENNEVVRVVSQDTYLPGMDLLGRDSLVGPKLSPRLVEEEVLHQTWELWGLDLGHWQDSVGLRPWAEGLGANIITPADRLGALAAYDDLAAAMSVADICSSKSFAGPQEVRRRDTDVYDLELT